MQLEVFGEPVTELEVKRCMKNIDTFFAEHSEKIRDVLEEAARYGGVAAFDQAVMGCRSVHNDPITQAEMAWQAIAWQHLVSPYDHESRQFYQNQEVLAEAVVKHHVALYKYALFILQEPKEDVYAALKRMSARAAKQYKEYCTWIEVARAMGRERDLQYLWRST